MPTMTDWDLVLDDAEKQVDYPNDPASIAKRMQEVMELDAKIRDFNEKHTALAKQRAKLADQLHRDAETLLALAKAAR